MQSLPFSKTVVLSASLTLFVLAALALSTLAITLLPGTPMHQSAFRSLLAENDDDNKSGGGACTSDEDCGGESQGTCEIDTSNNETTGVCVCTEKFADPNCDYERKNQLTAFLLSFLVGTWGADRFYLGFTALGVLKLLLTLANCAIGIGFQIFKLKKGEDAGTVIPLVGCCIACLVSLGVLAWWLTDWILIVAKSLGDSNGYPLYENL